MSRSASPDPKSGEIAWAGTQAFASQGRLQAELDAETAPEYRLRLMAKGYQPFESRAFRSDEGQVEYDVDSDEGGRSPGDVVSGVVRRPDGRPLAGAEVTLTYPLGGATAPTVRIEDGTIRRARIRRSSGPTPRAGSPCTASPTRRAALRRGRRPSRLLRRGRPRRVRGRPDDHREAMGPRRGRGPDRRQAGAGAAIRSFADRLGNPDVPRPRLGKDDGRRRGTFRPRSGGPRRRAGRQRLGEGPDNRPWSNGTLVEVRPGETVRAEVGGRGRPVVARIAPPEGFDPEADYAPYSEFEIESDRPRIPYPRELLARRDESMITWAKQWWASAEGHDYRRNWFRLGQAKLQPDGTIRADDLPPGDYRLRLTFSADPIYGLGALAERIAFATKQFTIPPSPAGGAMSRSTWASCGRSRSRRSRLASRPRRSRSRRSTADG